jgi:uncharacterized membrane protein (UPF0127 family)
MRALTVLLFLLIAVQPATAARAQDPTHPDTKVEFAESEIVIDTGTARRRFTVELALSRAQMVRGLMHRREMALDHGMLFLYKPPRRAGIWMRNTFIPLDIIFIKPDGTIESIHTGAKPHDETVIPSQSAVGAVLEVNAGVVRLLGIEPGDTVRHDLFGNAD